MQVTIGSHGEAVVSYVDDTSADRNPDFCHGCGETPAQAAGPIMIATQNAGPSLLASVGTIKGSPRAVGSVADAKGDARYFSAGDKASVPAALDVTGASIHQVDPFNLRVTLSTSDPHLAQDLAVDPSIGGPVGEWIVRWAAPTYSHPGDGNIFYVGMESSQGGAPEFYTGTTQTINTFEVKYFTFNKTNDIPGKISGNTISWTVPTALIGHPLKGDGLYSVTGFTASQPTPSLASHGKLPNGGEIGEVNIPNVFDSTPPFSFTVTSSPVIHVFSQSVSLSASGGRGSVKSRGRDGVSAPAAVRARAISARNTRGSGSSDAGIAGGLLGLGIMAGAFVRRRKVSG
jgi:hypothetical protein